MIGFEDTFDGLECIEARVGEPLDTLPLFDRRAIDLLDLTHEKLDEIHT